MSDALDGPAFPGSSKFVATNFQEPHRWVGLFCLRADGPDNRWVGLYRVADEAMR